MQDAASDWRPSGVLTLLTDFGTRDPYVGVMKGVMLSVFAQARIVDVSHAVPVQDVLTAAWFLHHSWTWFPAGTVHVAVVDPGVGSERSILVAESGGHVFLAPDNGLLGPVLAEGARVRRLTPERFARGEISRTFHGRDLFAPAAAALAGGASPGSVGPITQEWLRTRFPQVRRVGQELEAEVLIVDHFGNLVTNLAPAREGLALEEWDVFLGGGGLRVPVGATYAEVESGQVLALVDSYGHLEIAVRDGSAQARLGLERGSTVTLRRRT